MKRYRAADLRKLPTIHQGHFDNLKVENKFTRVWLSRCGKADGLPFDNGITVEKYRNGRWEEAATYAG